MNFERLMQLMQETTTENYQANFIEVQDILNETKNEVDALTTKVAALLETNQKLMLSQLQVPETTLEEEPKTYTEEDLINELKESLYDDEEE